MPDAPDDARPNDAGDAPASPAAPPIVVVGIGASAGGLEPLEAMLRRFTLDSMAFVVVQHLSPEYESRLPELLARWCNMAVVPATDGTRVEANCIYVITPGVDLAVMHGVLHLMPQPAERPRLPIDFFFRSLAEDFGAFAVGVVLSGTGSDGSLGLKAIKAAGGLTFAQDPATARFDGMPRAALDAGHADFCLAPEAIADELMSLSCHPYLRRGSPSGSIAAERLGKVLVLIRDTFGHDLSLYKRGTIERRVERRMAVHRIERLEDYVTYLQGDAAELERLYRDTLIGVTGFFRDGQPFDVLKSTVFPALLERRRGEGPARVWVPACSTGEEAYSIAMALLEFLGDRATRYKPQIFATDVDDAAVNAARRGFYPQQSVADVSEERLRRFFVARQDGYVVSRMVRDMVVFATQNVAKDPPFSRVDLVSCRNLLIYFQPPLQKRVLALFHYALVPDGHLLLGTSEGVGDSPDLFSLVDRGVKLYRRKALSVGVIPHVPLEPRPRPEATPATAPARPAVDVQQLADRELLERFSPPAVVLNEQLEVLQFRGKTAPYLEPQPGAASLHVFRLLRPELAFELRSILQRALETGAPVVTRGVTLTLEGVTRAVDLEARPIMEPRTRARCLVVLFLDAHEAAREGGLAVHRPADARLAELERELGAAKNFLQAAIEDLETSNEELKSSNEELQSSNEELQSSNEELETSKEELQSSNEELSTVNDELHSRMQELSESNDDLQNLLTVIDAPVVIVGLDRQIRRYTAAAARLLSLTPADVGRPMARLSTFAPAGLLERMVHDAIETLAASREEFAGTDRRRYRAAAVPYKTSGHAIRGAVLTFMELDAGRARPADAPAPDVSETV